MRRARNFLRDVRQQVLDGAGAAQPRLDLRRRPRRLPLGQQLVDVQPIAEIGRNASGRGVRLTHVALLLEPRHDVPKRGGGHAKPAAGQPQRRDGLPLVDVGLDQDPEDPSIPFRKLRMARHGYLAVDLPEC